MQLHPSGTCQQCVSERYFSWHWINVFIKFSPPPFPASSITSNRLRWINDTELPRSMQMLDMRANPLSTISAGAFRGMTKLRKL